jgi:hypothetical protein
MRATSQRSKNLPKFSRGKKERNEKFQPTRKIFCFSKATRPEVLRVVCSLRIIEGEKKRSQNKFKLDSRKDKQKIDLLFQEHAELEKNINLAQSQVCTNL